MTEDEFLAAMGAVSDETRQRTRKDNTGKLVLGLARVFIGIPMEPTDEGYPQQQALLNELQQAEDAHGHNLPAFPLMTRVMLVHMLKAVGEVTSDAMAFIILTLIKDANKGEQ